MKRIAKIETRRLVDPSPDVSFLESEIVGGRIGKSDRYSDSDIQTAGLPQVQSWIDGDTQRLRDHGDKWFMIGIRAEAEIQTSSDGSTWLSNTVSSGGLWNIESDSEESYLQEVESEQLSELRLALVDLGFLPQEIDAVTVSRVTKY